MELRQVWIADLRSDSLIKGRRFRGFNVIDDYKRQAICTTPAFSMPSIRIVDDLKEAFEVYGKPLMISADNGPEFLAKIFTQFCETEEVAIKCIHPGKPAQNGYAENLSKIFRENV